MDETRGIEPALPRESAAAVSAEVLDPRRLVVTTIASLLLLFGAIGLLAYYFREPIVAVSEAFVRVLGGPGVAIGYLIPDAFTIPLPNDTFGLFGLAGGMSFWSVVAWGTGGSVLGGCVGYFIGQRLRATRWVERFMKKGHGRNLELLIRRNGAVVVAVAAITPLPYSLASWAAGAVRMRFDLFVAVSLTRVIRVAVSLYLIQVGLMTAG